MEQPAAGRTICVVEGGGANVVRRRHADDDGGGSSMAAAALGRISSSRGHDRPRPHAPACS